MVSIARRPGAWEEEILDAARTEMKGEICFYREVKPDVPYNPVTGVGGDEGIAVYWRSKARIQQLRAPREFAEAYQANATRFFRFQIDPADRYNDAGLPYLPFGVKARVIAGGRDSHLESLAFVVNSGINSSNMAVRSVELSTNMKFVDWQWDPDAPDMGLFPSDGIYPSYNLFPIGS